MAAPVKVVCIYRVAKGNEAEFTRLLERHWPTLNELGLATDLRASHYQGEESPGKPVFFEVFEWVAGDTHERAYQHPEVQVIWDRMDKLTEARGDRPNMEFPHVRELELLGQA